jgi:hypothetical protein
MTKDVSKEYIASSVRTEELAGLCLLIPCLAYSSALKMKMPYSSETEGSLSTGLHSFISLYPRRQNPSQLRLWDCHTQKQHCLSKRSKVNLRTTVSRPVRLCVRRPSGTRDQFFFLHEISFRQLRVCNFCSDLSDDRTGLWFYCANASKPWATIIFFWRAPVNYLGVHERGIQNYFSAYRHTHTHVKPITSLTVVKTMRTMALEHTVCVLCGTMHVLPRKQPQQHVDAAESIRHTWLHCLEARPPRPLVRAPDDDGWRVWSSRWNAWQGRLKYSEETCSSATWFTTKPTRRDPGSNPGRRGGQSATNRLSYGTAPKRGASEECIQNFGRKIWIVYA